MIRSLICLPVLVALAFGASGCGGGSDVLKVYKATGTLTMDGEPFGPIKIMFVPLNEGGRSGLGKVDESGNITFVSYEDGDGLPAGEYRAAIGADLTAPPKPYPQAYAESANSPLRVTIEKNDNNIVKIEMDSSTPGPKVGGARSGMSRAMQAVQDAANKPAE